MSAKLSISTATTTSTAPLVAGTIETTTTTPATTTSSSGLITVTPITAIAATTIPMPVTTTIQLPITTTTAMTAAATTTIPLLVNHSVQQQQLQQQQTSSLQSQSSSMTTTTATITTATASTTAAASISATITRTMQSDEDFNIRFVNLVRQHKCLYDKKVPEYRNRDNQEKAWALISKETRESVIHCKERWRNLRACLSRYIKQQSGSDPQHKPYYLTEHMSFLLPFLKSTRNSTENGLTGSNLATFFQQQAALLPAHTIPMLNQHTPQLSIPGIDLSQAPVTPTNLSIKQSLSENDEETIDAFDPAITGGVNDMNIHNHNVAGSSEITSVGMNGSMNGSLNMRCSSALSDTASANTLENFIPDVQIKELDAPAVVTEDGIDYSGGMVVTPSSQAHHKVNTTVVSSGRHDSSDYSPPEGKRIKTECHASEATTSGQLHLFSSEENSDMEFFRSILTDIAALTPQQKRKFKIGVLELIDDVVERFPTTSANATNNLERSATNSSMLGLNGYANSISNINNNNNCNNYARHRRTSSRDWRK